MNELERVSRRGIVRYDPLVGLKSIAVAEASERYLRRAIKSPKMAGELLEKTLGELLRASEQRITEQAAYVAWRDGVVVHGGDRKSKSNCSTEI